MTTPIKLVVKNISIVDIWHKKEKRWFLFKYHSIVSDLWDFEDGETYIIEVSEPCIMRWNGREWPLTVGENTILWDDKIKFSCPDNAILNKEVWRWVEESYKRLGLDRLLSLAGITEVNVLSPEEFANKFPYATGSGYSANGIMWFKDFPWMPATAFLTAIGHEAWHEIQSKMGFFDGQNKNEWQAYAISQLIHLCYGDDLNVFKSNVYRPAVDLSNKDWP